jgi:exopolysaccharide biosynthesis polyprenyl glycosylphosphotransferase
MLKENKNLLAWSFRFLDTAIIASAFWVSYWIRFDGPPLSFVEINLEFKVFFLTHLVSWMVFSQWVGLYESKRFTNFVIEIWDVVKSIGLSTMVALMPAFFFRDFPLSRIFLVYLWAIEAGSLIAVRFALRRILKYIRLRGYNYRQVVIVGRNERSEAIRQKVLNTPELGVQILGFIDAPRSNKSEECLNCRVMGGLEHLEQIMRENVVDELIITLPVKSFYGEINQILDLCETIGVDVKIPTDLFSQKIAKSGISTFCNFEVIDFYTSPKMDMQIILKRLIDVLVSAVAMVLFIPIFLAISIAIKWTSTGPIFFSQKRIGYNGRTFNCLKFRTMVVDAEKLKSQLKDMNEMDGPVFKIKNDPRVTQIGRFLRKTSLDELPQLINVFKGDMSLVGPRPPVPEEVYQYQLADRRRLSIRPGITCIWQASGRNDIPFDEWMKLDRQYIDNWSLWLDMKILFKTLAAVLFQRGAQ